MSTESSLFASLSDVRLHKWIGHISVHIIDAEISTVKSARGNYRGNRAHQIFNWKFKFS